jgi:hypothetical protein
VGHHVELAQALHASAAQAVTNADLSFQQPARSRRGTTTPLRTRRGGIALGITAESQGRRHPHRQERLQQAAP